MAIKNQQNKFDLFNVGYGSSIAVGELVKKIISHSAKDIKIEYDLTKPTIKTKLCLDTTKAENSLGWSPKLSLDDGIEKTLTWYRENIKF